MRHRRRRYGRGSRGTSDFEIQIDMIAASVVPPLLYNGMLTIAGRDTSAITHLDNFNLDTTQNYQVQDPVWNQNLFKLQENEAFHEPFEGAFPETAEGADGNEGGEG